MNEPDIFWSFYGAYILAVITVVYYAHHTLFTKRNLATIAGLVHLKTLSSLVIGLVIGLAFYYLRVTHGEDTGEPGWLVALLLFTAYSVASLLWSLLGKVLMRDVGQYIRENGTRPALKLIAKRLSRFSAAPTPDEYDYCPEPPDGMQG